MTSIPQLHRKRDTAKAPDIQHGHTKKERTKEKKDTQRRFTPRYRRAHLWWLLLRLWYSFRHALGGAVRRGGYVHHACVPASTMLVRGRGGGDGRAIVFRRGGIVTTSRGLSSSRRTRAISAHHVCPHVGTYAGPIWFVRPTSRRGGFVLRLVRLALAPAKRPRSTPVAVARRAAVSRELWVDGVVGRPTDVSPAVAASVAALFAATVARLGALPTARRRRGSCHGAAVSRMRFV